jgi:uncharacterized phage protein gp47/JayE
VGQNDELEFGPIFDKTFTSEAAIDNRMAEDTNQGVEPGDEDYTDTRTGAIFQIAKAAIVQELGKFWDALSVEVPSAAFPTRAWGEYLDEWMAAFGEERNAAVRAKGYALFEGEEGALVPARTRVAATQTDPNIAPPEFVTVDEGGKISEEIELPTGEAGALEAGGTLVKEQDYFWVVTAINDYGETLASAEIKLKTTAVNQKVQLSWGAVAGAMGYNIYRSTATGTASKKRITTTVNTNYTDEGAAATEEGLPTENTTGGKYRAPIEAVVAGGAGNIGIGAITTILDALAGVDSVTNEDALLDGADEEDDEELRKRLLLEFQGGAAGNQTDYERWALRESASVGLVTVIPVADGPGTVTVVVMSPTGDQLSEDVVDDLQEVLDPLPGQGAGIAPIDHTVSVVTAEGVIITPVAEIEFDPGFSLDGAGGTVALRAIIAEAISGYVDMLGSGEDVIYDRVKAAIYSVEGVHKVLTLTVNGGTADIAISTSPAQTAQMATPILTE